MRREWTEEEENNILVSYAGGESMAAIARTFSVTFYEVNRVVSKSSLIKRCRSEVHSRCKIDHAAFDVLTPEACYWIGFLFADGTINKNRVVLGVALKDLIHLEKFKEFLKCDYKICIGKGSQGILKSGRTINGGPSARLYATSPCLIQRLNDLGMRNPGRLSDPCEELCNSRDFWRGVIDGDGWVCVTKYKEQFRNDFRAGRKVLVKAHDVAQIGLCGHLPLLEDYLTYIKSVIPSTTRALLTDESIFRVYLTSNNAIAVIHHLYNNASVFLDRKMIKAKQATQLSKNKELHIL